MFNAELPSPQIASEGAASVTAQRRSPSAPARAYASHSRARSATGSISEERDAIPVVVSSEPERIGSRHHLLRALECVRPYLANSAFRRPAKTDGHATAELNADSVVDRAAHQLTIARAQLRASLTAYVSCLNDDGAPPERMLVLVKAAVAESLGGAIPERLGVIAYGTMVADAVRWSIDAYYD